MLWQKEIVTITVVAGSGAANTKEMKGMIEQLIVVPQDANGAEVAAADWDLVITDRDGDIVRKYTSETGRVEDIRHIPAGADLSEKFTLAFSNITATPVTMRTILKVRETV